MATADRPASAGSFGEVMEIIDRLGKQSRPDAAYRLAFRVIFLRRKAPSAWADLAGKASHFARWGASSSSPTERALDVLWHQAGVECFLDLGSHGAVETPGLTGQGDQLLAKLIAAVAKEEHASAMFDACLDRFSHMLGSAGNYFTPRIINRLMVEVAAPVPGESVLDPACGSAGLLIEASRFARGQEPGTGELHLHGRDIDAEVREIAAMNLAMKSLSADLGERSTDSLRDRGTGLKCDVVLANPPFNMPDWGYEELKNDSRWIYGQPPRRQANFAWVQHILGELSAQGRAVILLADGAAKGVRAAEWEIRQQLVEKDVVAGIVSLPEGIFPHTPISACLWLLSKDKGAHPGWGRISRRRQVLFIDARRRARSAGRLSQDEVDRISRTVSAWRGNSSAGDIGVFEDQPGWCRSVGLDEIAEAHHDLMPSSYVRTARASGSALASESHERHMLRQELYSCFADATWLEQQLRSVLEER